MSRIFACACCTAVLALTFPPAIAAQTPDAEQTTVTATIEAIDKATRMVTLKGPQGSVDVQAPDQMEGFNSLKVGDQVTATYSKAIAMSVRKPGDPAPSAPPVTMTERKDRTPGSVTRRQQTFTATVVSVELKGPSVTVRDSKGRAIPLVVQDSRQVQNLKAGDTVDVTYYESLLIKVTRGQK